MKTPDEIKKAMSGCRSLGGCSNCPYFSFSVTLGCKVQRNADALAYIQQLEADNSRLQDTIRSLTELLNAAHEETAKAIRELAAYRWYEGEKEG